MSRNAGNSDHHKETINVNAHIIKPDGTKLEVLPINGKQFSLNEMRAAIGGGYVEKVNLGFTFGGEHVLMFVDEDGLMKELPLNEEASNLAERKIVGDVLICLSKQVA